MLRILIVFLHVFFLKTCRIRVPKLAEFIRICFNQQFCNKFGTLETDRWTDPRNGGLRWLAGCGWLAGWLGGWLAAGWVAGWLAGWLGWLAGGPAHVRKFL